MLAGAGCGWCCCAFACFSGRLMIAANSRSPASFSMKSMSVSAVALSTFGCLLQSATKSSGNFVSIVEIKKKL